jgi:AraC family L-rhamnose operon transcriptional activator RhaR/AraC family L-rhamnose operon regulatory protein RhaS
MNLFSAKNKSLFRRMDIPLTVMLAQHDDKPVALHAHEFIELVYFAEGRSDHIYAGKRYKLEPGDLFVVHPGEPHAYAENDKMRIFNCLFMPEVILPDLKYLKKMDGFFDLVMVEPFFRPEKGLRGVLHLDAPTQLRVHELLTDMIREIERGLPGREASVRAMLIQLLVLAARFHARILTDAKSEREELQEKRALIRACIRFIEEHYPEEIKLENLAERAFLSPEYFSKIFKRLTAQTPIEFINKVRLDKAKQLLFGTNLTVTEIAFRTGFHDSNYFARQFKKATGGTPLEFRKRKLAEYP